MKCGAEVLNKICQALLLLESDKDGEVVAAANGLRRILKSNDMTMYDVVELIKGHADNPRQQAFDIVAAVDQCGRALSPKEFTFIRSIKNKMATNTEYFPTPKQLQWVLDIYNRLNEVAHRQ